VTASHSAPDAPSSFFNSGAGMALDGILFDNVEAQSFTAEQTGILSDIALTASRLDVNTTADLRIDVVTWNPSDEVGQVLATGFLPAEGFSTGFLSQLNFNTFINFSSTSIEIVQGLEYALVFSTDVPNANYRLYGDRLGYSGGSRFQSQNGSPFDSGSGDLFFQARVVAIPEPGSGVCLVIGCFAGIAGRRKRRITNKNLTSRE